MFVDKVQVSVKAGNGGDGYLSFRQEKFIDKGGPDGGDGGNGGNVVFVASRNQNTLAAFRFQKEIKAQDGKAGFNRRKHGRSADDLMVAVPVGTVISVDGKVVADLTVDGQQEVIAKGGRGGFGNAHFVSSTRQAPRVAEKGEPGDEFEATLEMKMIADVGLVGLPNAGKSTFLAATSNARPEIANYPFTTLKPNLGVVDIDKESSLLFADIPGLIEGASQGKGLGDEFLRHVERTAVLVHLVDIYNDDVCEAYETIQKELKAYAADLTQLPQVVVLTKIDGLDDEIIHDKMNELQPIIPEGTRIFAISSQSKAGVKELLYAVKEIVAEEKARVHEQEDLDSQGMPILTIPVKENSWEVTRTDDGFVVTGNRIEKFAIRTDFSNFHATQRLRDIMRKMGIMHELTRKGIEPGDKIIIGKQSLVY
jgi:GTP-binding protein